MIVSETSITADLFGEFVSTVGFVGINAISNAMVAAIGESDEDRRRKADATEAIVSSIHEGHMSTQIMTS
jgi:hypothetical protein